MTPKTWTTPAGARNNFYNDVLQQTHILIAGATGSGKSVLVNGLIWNALYRAPGAGLGQMQLILIDPKRVELIQYCLLPHTLVYASEPDNMPQALEYALALAEARYRVMQAQGQRLFPGGDVYVIIDELADLMTTCKKRVLPVLQRLGQIGRAAKIHLIACTQCPLAKIIPTELKVNFDTIIGLHTASAQHSRNILGVTGCEALPRYGEALVQFPGEPIRHCVNIPLFSDAVLAERVKWWTDQANPPKQPVFKRFFSRRD